VRELSLVAHSQFIGFKVVPCAVVEHVVIATILVMPVRGHGPDCILETHWGPLMRSRRIECLHVPRLVDKRDEALLGLEEYFMSALSE